MAKNFEERCTDAMETIAGAMESISKTNENLLKSQRMLNDNFLLHQANSEKAHELLAACTNGLGADIHGIRDDFKATMYPIFRWMAVAVIVIAGGTAVGKLLLGM